MVMKVGFGDRNKFKSKSEITSFEAFNEKLKIFLGFNLFNYKIELGLP